MNNDNSKFYYNIVIKKALDGKKIHRKKWNQQSIFHKNNWNQQNIFDKNSWDQHLSIQTNSHLNCQLPKLRVLKWVSECVFVVYTHAYINIKNENISIYMWSRKSYTMFWLYFYVIFLFIVWANQCHQGSIRGEKQVHGAVGTERKVTKLTVYF